MAGGRAIDHVVPTVRDLDRTAVTYQKLGFTLTPRAAHEDRMDTSNQLANARHWQNLIFPYLPFQRQDDAGPKAGRPSLLSLKIPMGGGHRGHLWP